VTTPFNRSTTNSDGKGLKAQICIGFSPGWVPSIYTVFLYNLPDRWTGEPKGITE
jgi:hypothetical protein